MVEREDPRVVRSRACILAAAVEALEHQGAAGVTIEGVAERAGVAKTTVYRSWSDRNELLMAAFEQVSQKSPLTGTDDLAADLLDQVRGVYRALHHERWAPILAALIDQAERDAKMAELCREMSERKRSGLIERLEAAIDRGELRTDANAELVAAQLTGPVFYRRYFTRQTFTDAELVELVDRVLAPVRVGGDPLS